MKDFLKTYWFGLLILAFIAGCTGYNYYSSHQKELERLQKELEQEKEERRKQHIEDSIKATPEYIDSVRKSEEFYAEWRKFEEDVEEEEIVGFVYGNDTIYHSVFHSVHTLRKLNNKEMFVSSNFLKDEEKYLRFVCNYEVRDLGLKLCVECDEINSAYLEYLDGELIRREDARDYVDDDY